MLTGIAYHDNTSSASASIRSFEQEQPQPHLVSSSPSIREGGSSTLRSGPEEQESQRRSAPEEEEKDFSPLLRPEEDLEDQEAGDQVQSPCPEGTVLGTKGVGGECVSPDSEEEESGSFKAAPVAISGNNVYIAWPTNETGKDEVMFRASADGGATFADKINLSNTTDADSQNVELAADGDEVIVTWWERNATSDKPVLRASVDNGLTFGPVLQLATNGTIGEAIEEEAGQD